MNLAPWQRDKKVHIPIKLIASHGIESVGSKSSAKPKCLMVVTFWAIKCAFSEWEWHGHVFRQT